MEHIVSNIKNAFRIRTINIAENGKFSEQAGRIQHWTLKLDLMHSKWNGVKRWIGFVQVVSQTKPLRLCKQNVEGNKTQSLPCFG